MELETAISQTRFNACAAAHPVLVAVTPEPAEYARWLGRAVDKLAGEAPLPGPARVEDEPGLVPIPESIPESSDSLPSGRTLRLAAVAFVGAALSGPKRLVAAEMQARVRGCSLATRAAPAVRDAVLALRAPALLIRPGLFARCDPMAWTTPTGRSLGGIRARTAAPTGERPGPALEQRLGAIRRIG